MKKQSGVISALVLLSVGLGGGFALSYYSADSYRSAYEEEVGINSALVDEIDTLNLKINALSTENEILKSEIESLHLSLDELQAEYDNVSSNKLGISLGIELPNFKNKTDNNDIDLDNIFKYNSTRDLYEVTANDIVALYNKDKQKLSELTGKEVKITGKVKGFSYGETLKTGGKAVAISPKITLDNDLLQSFTGIHCYGADLTLNGILVDYEDKLNENCMVSITGLADLGLTFTLSDCYEVEMLDNNGNVIDTWKTGELRTEFKNKGVEVDE